MKVLVQEHRLKDSDAEHAAREENAMPLRRRRVANKLDKTSAMNFILKRHKMVLALRTSTVSDRQTAARRR